MTETYKLEEEGEYIPYCIGSIRHDGVVSTSNRLIRPIELSANEYKALLYAMAAANQTEKITALVKLLSKLISIYIRTI